MKSLCDSPRSLERNANAAFTPRALRRMSGRIRVPRHGSPESRGADRCGDDDSSGQKVLAANNFSVLSFDERQRNCFVLLLDFAFGLVSHSTCLIAEYFLPRRHHVCESMAIPAVSLSIY